MSRLLLTIFIVAAVRSSFAQDVHPQLAAAARGFVEREAAGALAATGGQGRIEVTVGEFDARARLAPCARTEFFVPGGTRLWGRARIGLRCVQGANWSVLLPVNVRIHGPALVASRHLAALQPIAEGDGHVAEVEWTREALGVATDFAQLDNRVPTRPIAPGQPIPVAALRAPQVVSQGDAVKVVGTGRGFSVSTAAVALAAAQDGQPVRVRTDSGRVLTGTARAGRIVEVVF
ncbi:MAG: flagellar basal body P-ring formation chaperone FlgA [Burkholderiaceae bacterium]